MANYMIAIASNWEEILRPPKCDKKDNPQVWSASFINLLISTRERKKLIYQVACIG